MSLLLAALGAVVALCSMLLAPLAPAVNRAAAPTAPGSSGGAQASSTCGQSTAVATETGCGGNALALLPPLAPTQAPATTAALTPPALGVPPSGLALPSPSPTPAVIATPTSVLGPLTASPTPTASQATATPSSVPGALTASPTPPALSSAGVPPVGPAAPPPASWVQSTLDSLGRAAGAGLSDALRGIVNWALSFGFLVLTPAALSYEHPVVIRLNAWLSGVMDGAVVLVLVLAAYQVFFLGRQGDLSELLPRLIVATVLGHFSLFFLGQVIELLNLLSLEAEALFGLAGVQLFALPTPLDWQSIPLYEGFTYLLDLGVLVLLCFQMAARLALLDLLAILLALLPLLYVLRLTRLWAALAMRALVAVLVIQFLQVLCAGMGAALMSSLVGGTSATPISLLVGAAALFLVVRLPDMLLMSVLRGMRQSAESMGQMSRVVIETVSTLLARI